MSVLIRGMKIPKACSDCEWSYYVDNGRAMCRRVSKTDKTDIMTKRRADFCPLTEIHTPHGRLIDADKLLEKAYWDYNEATDDYNNFKVVSEYDIADAPTVIEAEGETE